MRFSLTCNYSFGGSSDNPEPHNFMPRKRGRPRKDWSALSAESNLLIDEPDASSSTMKESVFSLTPSPAASLERPLHLPWGVEDLELLHHYMSSVALSGKDTPFWRDQLPRFAFCHYSVLHLILAISALHLARREANRADELVERAEAHLTVGLHQVNQTLPNLNEENCTELYISTILICVCTLAKKPGPRHLLVVSDGQEVAWWELFRGVRIMVETFGISNVVAKLTNDTASQPTAKPDEEADQDEVNHILPKVIQWEGALNDLFSLITAAPDGMREVYQSTVGTLVWCFQETYGSSAETKPVADIKFQTIFVWLYRLEDAFVDSLKEREPIALVILAHFAVLLQTLEVVWFLRGWASHIVEAVSEILASSPCSQWIQWPVRQVQSGSVCSNN